MTLFFALMAIFLNSHSTSAAILGDMSMARRSGGDVDHGLVWMNEVNTVEPPPDGEEQWSKYGLTPRRFTLSKKQLTNRSDNGGEALFQKNEDSNWQLTSANSDHHEETGDHAQSIIRIFDSLERSRTSVATPISNQDSIKQKLGYRYSLFGRR